MCLRPDSGWHFQLLLQDTGGPKLVLLAMRATGSLVCCSLCCHQAWLDHKTASRIYSLKKKQQQPNVGRACMARLVHTTGGVICFSISNDPRPVVAELQPLRTRLHTCCRAATQIAVTGVVLPCVVQFVPFSVCVDLVRAEL